MCRVDVHDEGVNTIIISAGWGVSQGQFCSNVFDWMILNGVLSPEQSKIILKYMDSVSKHKRIILSNMVVRFIYRKSTE